MEYTIPHSILQSNDWNCRLNDVKRLACKAEQGSTFFLEVSSSPIVSLFIVTGDFSDKSKKERSTHLHFAPQTDEYPKMLASQKEVENMGYRKYMHNRKQDDKILNIEQYKAKLYSVFEGIDNAIRTNHGIKCYADGDRTNLDGMNVFFLHICDVLNLMVMKKKEYIAEVVIKSNMLKDLPVNITNDFETHFLKHSNEAFLYSEVDFIYYCYAYLGNTSFIPIRTKIDINDDIFINSRFFMNNDHFLKHQYGKLQEINQNGCGFISKLAYRSI